MGSVINNNMCVTVIIPNYNHCKFLKDRVDSVLRQGQVVSRIIILDDASTDDSLEYLSTINDNRVELVYNEVNSGNVFKQWNKGLSLVEENSLVWIAESDDVAHEDFLRKVLPVFDDPQIVMAYTRSTDIDESNNQLSLSYANLSWCNMSFIKSGELEVNDHLFKQCTIPNVSAVIFRKNAVESGFFSHDFRLCGDWYFYLQLLKKGKLAYFSEPLNFHRFHSNTVRNKSRRSLAILEERILIVNGMFESYKLNKLKYKESINFQIETFVTETSFVDLFSRKGMDLFSLVRSLGLSFVADLLILLAFQIIKRAFILLFSSINSILISIFTIKYARSN